jgi:hypothetical protein
MPCLIAEKEGLFDTHRSEALPTHESRNTGFRIPASPSVRIPQTNKAPKRMPCLIAEKEGLFDTHRSEALPTHESRNTGFRTPASPSVRIPQTNKAPKRMPCLIAEKEGFEPPVPLGETTDFESAPFDHSGISPGAKIVIKSIASGCVMHEKEDFKRQSREGRHPSDLWKKMNFFVYSPFSQKQTLLSGFICDKIQRADIARIIGTEKKGLPAVIPGGSSNYFKSETMLVYFCFQALYSLKHVSLKKSEKQKSL